MQNLLDSANSDPRLQGGILCAKGLDVISNIKQRRFELDDHLMTNSVKLRESEEHSGG